MKNNFCDLNEEEINKTNEKFHPFFMSPYHFNLRNGVVTVPEDSFKRMIYLLTEYSKKYPLLNPWKDAEKEKPDNFAKFLVELDCYEYAIAHFEPSINVWDIYDKELREFKVIAWMHIPKNEG